MSYRSTYPTPQTHSKLFGWYGTVIIQNLKNSNYRKHRWLVLTHLPYPSVSRWPRPCRTLHIHPSTALISSKRHSIPHRSPSWYPSPHTPVQTIFRSNKAASAKHMLSQRQGNQYPDCCPNTNRRQWILKVFIVKTISPSKGLAIFTIKNFVPSSSPFSRGLEYYNMLAVGTYQHSPVQSRKPLSVSGRGPSLTVSAFSAHPLTFVVSGNTVTLK